MTSLLTALISAAGAALLSVVAYVLGGRQKIKVDSADRLTDTALDLVEGLRREIERVTLAQLAAQEELAEARGQLTEQRHLLERQSEELALLRGEVTSLRNELSRHGIPWPPIAPPMPPTTP